MLDSAEDVGMAHGNTDNDEWLGSQGLRRAQSLRLICSSASKLLRQLVRITTPVWHCAP